MSKVWITVKISTSVDPSDIRDSCPVWIIVNKRMLTIGHRTNVILVVKGLHKFIQNHCNLLQNKVLYYHKNWLCNKRAFRTVCQAVYMFSFFIGRNQLPACKNEKEEKISHESTDCKLILFWGEEHSISAMFFIIGNWKREKGDR